MSDQSPEVVEMNNNQPQYQMMAMPQDPITFLVMAPFMPLMMFFSAMQSMMPGQMYSGQARTKITSITRNGNTMDIMERWV